MSTVRHHQHGAATPTYMVGIVAIAASIDPVAAPIDTAAAIEAKSAPRPDSRQTETPCAASPSSNARYSDFMASVAMIPPETKGRELKTNLDELFSDYNPSVSSHVRTDFVADAKKLQTATKLVRKDLSEEGLDRLSANVNQRRQKNTPNLLRRAHTRLQQHVESPTLIDGTAIEAINLGSCECLLRILNLYKTKFPNQSVDDLWHAHNGILHGIAYTKRALETALKRLRDVDITDNAEDGSNSGFIDDGAALNPGSAIDNQADGNDDTDNADYADNMDPGGNISPGEQHTTSSTGHSYVLGTLAGPSVPVPPPPASEQGNEGGRATGPRSRGRAASVDEPTEDRRPPNPSLINKGQADPVELEPPPKRRCREGSHHSTRMTAGLAALDLARLTSHQCLNADIVNTAIGLIVALCPLSVHHIDSDLADGQMTSLSPDVLARLPKYPDGGLVAAPLHLPDSHHWILAIASAGKVHVLDSFATRSPELVAKALHLRRLICVAPESEDVRQEAESVIEHLDCHQQDNNVDCGVAVIVNMCRLVAGQAHFNVPMDFALWRCIIASLPDPARNTRVINREVFSPLSAMDVELPHHHRLPMMPISLAECAAWYQAQASHLEAFRVSITSKVAPLLDKCKALASALQDAEDMGVFSDEVSDAVTRYRSLINEVKHMPFQDAGSLACLEKKLSWLQSLQESRQTAQDHLGRTLMFIREDRIWLKQLEDSALGINRALGLSDDG
ncbi:hypothetical protein LX32DRAFT_687077 [Colletotrichum zoysiae]|uniref:Uncharacterized protein n=1 Tax=Colletotrichum zoysiae TaxID=1216348 RepID=A0AAD9H581_9PEZI|nr:hypothetical protein LX32DRAFT_687077 [Colletotrichum zoysiae]